MTRATLHLTAALGLLLLVAPLAAQDTLPILPWTLSPAMVTTGQDFSLTTFSARYSCAHGFSNQSVVVLGNRIELTFLAEADSAVVCPADNQLYGPAFKLPALKEGRYEVHLNLLLPCHLHDCKRIVPRELAGILTVSEGGLASFTLEPRQAAAETEFVLHLLNPEFACNTEYSRITSRVQDGKITLTFLAKPNPLIRCIPESKLYGPAFRVAGLKAGTYEVGVEQQPACFEQGCLMLPRFASAGKLTVIPKGEVRKGWFLQEREVKAGSPFTMQVVNHLYGSCNTSFDHTSLVVRDDGLGVSFAIQEHPERVCVRDVRPHGPTFPLQGLKPGRYPVTLQALPACVYAEPSCLPVVLLQAPQVVDTLFVTASPSLSLGGTRGSTAAEAWAGWRDGFLRLRLPAGAEGLWRVDVLSLSGRLLHCAPMAAGDVVLPGLKPYGTVLVRLTSPSRKIQMLKVPVAE